jgi:hypothetical protein
MPARPRPARSTSIAFAAAGFALAGLGCGQELKESYSLEIVGMAGNIFADATLVTLEINGSEAARVAVVPNTPINLSIPNIDPATMPRAKFTVRAVNAQGRVVAYGQTPEMELLNQSAKLRVFVQAPGTISRGQDTDAPFSNHVAVAATAIPVPPLDVVMTVPFFGLGKTRSMTTSKEIFGVEVAVYNPLTHFPDRLGTLASFGGANPDPRADAAAFSRPDGTVFVFGGLIESTDPATPARASGQIDVFHVRRDGLSDFFLEPVAAQSEPAAARSATVLAAVGTPVLAFGGLDDKGKALDTVVTIDPEMGGAKPILPTQAKLLATRSGHSATAVSPKAGNFEVLVFGGAPAAGPVAELFDPATMTSVPIDAPAGSARRNHVALLLKRDVQQVLIIGGTDGTKVFDDGILYASDQRTFTPNVLKLRTARHDFTAFIVNKDIVVYGGRGADGDILADGEIFDLVTLMPATPPTFQATEARAGASATVLANESVVLLGGQTPDKVMRMAGVLGVTLPSNVVEIYQPRR